MGDMGAGTARSLMARDVLDDMNRGYGRGMDQLDRQHSASVGMPSNMLSQSLKGIQELANSGYGQLSSGMNQFYAAQNNPANRAQFGTVLGALSRGYRDARADIGTMAGYNRNDVSSFGRGIGLYQPDPVRAMPPGTPPSYFYGNK